MESDIALELGDRLIWVGVFLLALVFVGCIVAMARRLRSHSFDRDPIDPLLAFTELSQVVKQFVETVQLQNSNVNTEAKPLKIPKFQFSGLTGEKPRNFLMSMEEFKQTHRYRADDMLHIVPNCLTGSALLWYRGQPRPFRTYNEFEMEFVLRYLPPRRQRQIKQLLHKTRQEVQETGLQYLDRLKDLEQQLDRPLPEIEFIEIALENMTDHFQEIIRANPPEMIGELYQRVNDVQELVDRKKARESVWDIQSRNVGRSCSGNLSKGVSWGDSSLPKSPRSSSPVQGGGDRENMTDSFRNWRGSPIRAMRSSVDYNQGSNGRGMDFRNKPVDVGGIPGAGQSFGRAFEGRDTSNFRSVGNGKCYRCGREGHYARDCTGNARGGGN